MQTFSELTGLTYGLHNIDQLFEETDYLGEGGNGRVYEWSYRLNGYKFASKQVSKLILALIVYEQLSSLPQLLYRLVTDHGSWTSGHN